MTTATINTQYRTEGNFVRLFKIAVDRAEKKVGKAVFDFQPLVIRQALVSAELFTIVNEQDDDISDARVRTLGLVLHQMVGTWKV